MTFLKITAHLALVCWAYAQLYACRVFGSPPVCEKKARPVSPMLAHAIMGQNFSGLSAMTQCFGIVPTTEVSDVWIDEAYLRERKDTHVLIAVPTHSINDLDVLVKRRWGVSLLCRPTWLQSRLFAWRRGRYIQWHLLPKYPVGDELRGVEARVLVYACLVQWLANKKENGILFLDRCIPCDDVDADGCRICVTFLGAGISVNRCADGQGDTVTHVPNEFTAHLPTQ